jgi:phosphoribosylamine--glycine ligase
LKVLIIGGGGREHALAWRLAKSPSVTEVYASPGNPGIAQIGTCLTPAKDLKDYAAQAEEFDIDLTVVGPEAPLVAGIVDEFRSRGLAIVGPSQRAAQLEGSKIFAKQFFSRAGIPTARSEQTTNLDEALAALKHFSLPVVIKADGLAAGKGVIVATTGKEAREAVEALGPALVIEEFLEGREVSFIALSDGQHLYPFPASQDHKRVGDGDQGPNTGGMGAYVDPGILSDKESGRILDEIMHPAIALMSKEGSPFTGFLYAGLMMTAEGPKLLEFNVRMGDPETQAILYAVEGDLGEFFLSPASTRLRSVKSTICVVLAAEGYPEKPHVGQQISGIEDAESAGATVFQAGTRLKDGKLITSGGRVLGVNADGEDLATAIQTAYAALGKIRFAGMQYRRDIGARGLRDTLPAVGT